jgi:hypothetical protein
MRGGEYGDYLRSKGWYWMDFPTQLYGPGTILSLSRERGPEFISKISSCVPSSFIKIYDMSTAVPDLERKVALDAEALVQFHHVGQAKSSFREIRTTILDLNRVRHQAIDIILIMNYIVKHAGSLSDACRRELSRPDVYIVSEALVSSDYSYSLLAETGGQIKATLEKIRDWFDISGSVRAHATEDGKLVFSEPLYYAFKNASGISFAGIRGGNIPEDPTQIMNAYLQSHQPRFGQNNRREPQK